MDKNNILAIICICLICIIVSIGIKECDNNKQNKEYIENSIDTTYNTKVLDSIEYKIIEKDTVINKLKYEMDNEKNKVYTLNDSATIILFYQLCTE